MAKISLKTPLEIAVMAQGGARLGSILDEVLEKIAPGISTGEINDWIEQGIKEAGGSASFKTVKNYSWASCIGINEEVVHSLPLTKKIVKEGDLLKIDLGMLWKGWHTDLSWTVEVGSNLPAGEAGKLETMDEKKRFLDAGKRALKKAIAVAVPGNRIGHISQVIEETINKAGFRPVEALTGHGIGRSLHESPFIPGVLRGSLEKTEKLAVGMTLAIEVIYGQKSPDIVLCNDGWTICTKDGKIAGLFEETIAVTEKGPLILTPTKVFGKGDKE